MNKPIFYYLGLFLALLSFFCGAFCFKYPQRAIAFQQYFYSKINWRIEPISVAKEIKNTRVMGIFLLILSLATFYLLIRRSS
jgi:hypothetical protein